MKLRNKKTGKSAEIPDDDMSIKCAEILATIRDDEWELVEDYEEPEGCWYIDSTGEAREGVLDADWRDEREIGNFFETEEEAEKAVEKLKAWKRLKDKGFQFIDFRLEPYNQSISYGFRDCKAFPYDNEIQKDLDLLFGGGE